MPRFLSLFSSSSSFPPLPPLPSSQRNSIENRELDHLKYARNANDCSPGLIDAAHNFLSHKGNVRPGIHEYLGSGYRECQRVIFINNSRSLPISKSDILRPAISHFFLSSLSNSGTQCSLLSFASILLPISPPSPPCLRSL